MNYSEIENQDLINKYHQIYVDICGEYAEEVDRWIAYSMTGDTFFNTNFLFNLGQSAANGKSTISYMYQKVLAYIGMKLVLILLIIKIKIIESLFKYQTGRHLFCDERDIYNINFELFKLICEIKMTIKTIIE